MNGLHLGCIADDFTGATDLANNLVRVGMRTVQTIGVPAEGEAPPDADAVVVALKSRTVPAAEAVRQSLAACRWLRRAGAAQIYFKVCSTFDSTPAGNIGPVMEALMDELGCDFAIATPAFPDNGRTVFKGHLFVGDLLLSDSGMRHHPLTPMTDANLVRVLQAQLDPARGRRVGLLDHRRVAAGGARLAERLDALRAEGVAIAIADAVDNDDLLRLGAAVGALPLVCAGSGLAIGLGGGRPGPRPAAPPSRLPPVPGHAAIVSGSCSTATLGQVADFVAHGGAAWKIDAASVVGVGVGVGVGGSGSGSGGGGGSGGGSGSGTDSRTDPSAVATAAAAWARGVWAERPEAPVLVYSSAPPAAVQAAQALVGADIAGARIEQTLAAVASALVAAGARRLVVAGGETSGACVQALGIRRLQIGPQIDPGVPWCHAPTAAGGLLIALKSGNFGAPDFFSRAFRLLDDR